MLAERILAAPPAEADEGPPAAPAGLIVLLLGTLPACGV